MPPERLSPQPNTPTRRYPRRPARFEVHGVSTADGFHAIAHNVCEQGMAFQAPARFEPGDRLQIVVPVPQTSDAIRLLCEVRHWQAPGLTGVKFLEVSQLDRARVLQMVAHEFSDERKTGT